MADMHFDAAIAAGQRDAAGCKFAEVEDRVLHPRQQVLAAGGQEDAVFLGDVAVVGEEQIDVRLRLLSPGGEQGVADLVMTVLCARREVAQALPVDDVEPVLAAGIEGIDLDVDPARQLAQDVEVERRQGVQAEDTGARG